jgi:2-polyprenyl-3-methyl-5-hydroxy-6-metoxy-1,4-benzoquinol methylase
MSHAAAKDFIRDGVHRGPRIATHSHHDIIECETCGFKHALPLPDLAALEQVYREDYYTQEKPTFLSHAGEDQVWGELGQTDKLEILETLLPPDRRRLLDVGCGPGFFLQTAIRRGWLAHGIEPSRQAAAHARTLGATVNEGFFNKDSAAALGRFDVITLSNVLEHVPDPAHLIRLAHGLLEPGGAICVTVPNEFSPTQIAGRAAAGVGDWWVAPPHHLNYFNFDSLTALLSRAGFIAKARTTSFPMEAFLMMGENYVNDPGLGRACHNRRKKFDLAFEAAGLKETRRGFYRALAQLGVGREVVVIAVKADT